MTIPPDHELAALRTLLELRTRERDEARAGAIEEAAKVCEARASRAQQAMDIARRNGHAAIVDHWQTIRDEAGALSRDVCALLNTTGGDHER